jgi:hypothetical protein
MPRPSPFLRQLACLLVLAMAIPHLARAAEAPATAPVPAEPPARKAPPERTYSNMPFVHRIVVLDEDGTVIRPTKPGEEAAPGGAPASSKPMSQQKTCGKCHSDYDVMQQGLHFNFSRSDAPHGRAGEPWILTDPQTRTQLPLSYRGWKGTFHPYDLGLNDFNFAKLFGRHHPGGGALQTSGDLRFTMSGALENDCLICHTGENTGYDAEARARAIANDQNFKYAPTLAAFLGKAQGQASRLRDNFDPTGPDAKRAPKINYEPSRFDAATGEVLFDIKRRVSNERCYQCHTNVDVGREAGKGMAALESRWTHDRDIHLVKGMLCVDCHRNGADHMMVRGYEGEFADRAAIAGTGSKPDPTIRTLTCAGCHYGTETLPGGRNAAPRPVHHGMPTLHFDKLSCTACHSGPLPADATSLVQTAMAHRLGLERHETHDAAAPTIQQPVFLRDEKTGKMTPHRVVRSSYWAWFDGGKLTPILPEIVAAAAGDAILGAKPNPKEPKAIEPLSEEQILQVLEKLATTPLPVMKPADAVTARGATTSPATAPGTQPSREPAFVTGGKWYKRDAGKLVSGPEPAATYAWPLAHDVRPAQQSLGARGCVQCHASDAPIFDSKVSSAAVISKASIMTPMHEFRGDSMGALRAFGATYPLRWPLIWIGYASAAVLLLVLIKHATAAIGGGGRGR